VGLKLLMTGVTRNEVELDAGPPGALTVIGPVLAPAGTFTVIDEVVQLVAAAASTPLNATVLAPWLAPKFVPVMTTVVAIGPLGGENEVTVAGGATVNALVAVPPGVVKVKLPVVAPFGTTVLT